MLRLLRGRRPGAYLILSPMQNSSIQIIRAQISSKRKVLAE